jgi:hypothetical protein
MFFFFLPVGVDYQARRWPIVTFSLMAACVLSKGFPRMARVV